MISVIVPVYNTEKYLCRCIESLLNQSYENFELFFINDCSPDDSEKIIKSYAERDNRINYYKNEHNLGCEKSRIVALGLCKGDYVTFVDSDDYVATDFLKKMIDPIEIDNSIDSVVLISKKVFSNKYVYEKTESSKPLKKDKNLSKNQIMNFYLGKSNILKMGAVKLFKKSILVDAFKSIPDDVPHKVSDDIMFTYQYYKRSQNVIVRFIESYFYEQSNISICRSLSEKSLDNISVWDFIFEDYKKTFNNKNISSVSYSLLLSLRYTLYKAFRSDNLKIKNERISEIKQIVKKVPSRYKIRHLIIYLEIILLLKLNKTKRV